MSNTTVLSKLRGLVTEYDAESTGIKGMLDRNFIFDGMRLQTMAAHGAQEELVGRIRVALQHIDEGEEAARWVAAVKQQVDRKLLMPGGGSSTNPITNYIDLLAIQFNARVARILNGENY